MASVSLLVVFVLSHLVLLHSAEERKGEHPLCWPFQCGKLVDISFPFTEFPTPLCGFLQVDCDETRPMIRLPPGVPESERRYELIKFSSTNATTQHIRVKDHSLSEYLNTKKCNHLVNITLLNIRFISFKLTTANRTLFKCNRTLHGTSYRNFKNTTCRDHYNIYYSPSNKATQSSPSECSTIQLPVNDTSHEDELNLIDEFDLELHVSDDCSHCHGKEGKGIDIGITQKCFDAHTHVHS